MFSLCYFHACVCERRKFGSQGWNLSYPFSVGDLTISVYVLFNYLEANRNIPWDDLRYLFGEIMYGGHVCKIELKLNLNQIICINVHFLKYFRIISDN